MKVLKQLYLIKSKRIAQFLDKDREALKFFLHRLRYVAERNDNKFERIIRIAIPKSISNILNRKETPIDKVIISLTGDSFRFFLSSFLIELTENEAVNLESYLDMDLSTFIIEFKKFIKI